MNLKSILPIATLIAVGVTGLLPPSPALARKRDKPAEDAQAAGQIIPYACYDRAGNVVFTTTNPKETIGWPMGCRQVQYESSNPTSPPLVYFQCFDRNGSLAFSTVDEKVAKDSKLRCNEIGSRLSSPVTARPIFYECFNANGTLAFITSYPQETFGWKPGCREQQQGTVAATQQSTPSGTTYACLDTSGNIAFTTSDPQEVRRWKIGCRRQ
jgi:hypothetical protein